MNIVKYKEWRIWFYSIDFTGKVNHLIISNVFQGLFISEISALDFAYLIWLV